MYHSTGDGTWTGQSSPTAVLLNGVWGSGPSDVYAAGDHGTIQRSTGDGSWSVEADGIDA